MSASGAADTLASTTRAAIEAVWRIESARLIGGLARMVRDVGVAEDLAHDALVAALERWPSDGVPENPGAWLLATARERAAVLATEAAVDEDVGDDLLRLLFVVCHPILSRDARLSLTLRLLGGLTTEEIAQAFLVPEVTIARRIVRAKRTLTEARVPFELPRGPALRPRLGPVLEVIYVVFNEGYSATAGDAWMRPALCEDALRLGRILAALVPDEAEVHGLVALMELHTSRARARIGSEGEPILLPEQDRGRWDQLLVRRGLSALARAEALARPLGPYALQAAIASCHATARTAGETNWDRIVALYDALVELTQSPVVELNRAVAVSMALGPEEGLELVDELAKEPSLRGYHLLPSVRGDLLSKVGRLDEARSEFERAAFMTTNTRERDILLARARSCRAAPVPS